MYKYNLLSLHKSLVMCALTRWYWITNWSLLQGTIASLLSAPPLLPVVLCLGLRPHGLSPIHARVPIDVLLQDGILIVRKYKENVGRS